MTWITSMLALRQRDTTLWDLTKTTKIGKHLPKLRPVMIPDDAIDPADRS